MKKLFSLLLVFTLFGCASIKNDYQGIEGDTAVEQISEEAVVELLESGTGVLLFSYPDSEWCQELMPLLNAEALKSETTVYYYNVQNIREKNTESYQAIYSEIHAFVTLRSHEQFYSSYYDPEDVTNVQSVVDPLLYEEIYVPTLIRVENGEIVDFHLGTTLDHVETAEGVPALTPSQKSVLTAVIKRFLD